MSSGPTCPDASCSPAECRHPGLCPLDRVRAGATVVVRQLTAAPEVNQRLREMGFAEDQRVRVIQMHHTLLCQVCNSRLGLSARLAAHILVESSSALRAAA